jgi:uncharacterized protein YebE (UPF0316 family)
MHAIRALLIAVLVMTEVGLWQWRMVVADRGRRATVMVLGATGAILQITAISQVVTNLDDPLSIAGYACGVGMGVLVGLIAGDRFTPGRIGVTVITDEPGVADGLWARGWPVTRQAGDGESGPLDVLFVMVARQQASALRADVSRLAPNALWSSVDLGSGAANYVPTRKSERPDLAQPAGGDAARPAHWRT